MAIQKPRIINGAAKHKSSPAKKAVDTQNIARYVAIALLVVASFLGAYKYAQAQGAQGASPAAAATVGGVAQAGGSGGAGAAGGGSCCGGGGGAPVTGSALLKGGVQKINVSVQGGYSPNVIQLKAGVPTEITFGQSSGCTSIVQSSQLNFSEDLSAGPKTVKLAGLQPGTYGFACGMGMVQGQIVVQ